MNRSPQRLRTALIAAFYAGLEDLDPALLVERALASEAPEADRALEMPATAAAWPRTRSGRVVVIAAGKAALKMARGALNAWGDRIDAGLVVAPPAYPAAELASDNDALGPLRIVRAAHPIPDAHSVAAADEALALAARLGPQELLLALISGGASALLSAPPPEVSLEDKRILVATLLEGGAPIQEVNLVRRHFSRVKGGRLAAAASPARVLTLLMSDVIGGLAHDISSGPTVMDPTHLTEALATLRRWAPQLDRLAPAFTESLKPGGAQQLEARMLADPDALAHRIAARLSGATGLHVVTTPAEAGDARRIVAQRVALARALAPGEAVVIPCEPTLVLPARRGAGGRAGWIALAAMRDLPPDTALLCAASDGADGSSGAAGAAVTRADAAFIAASAIDAALDGFDDASIHQALRTRLDGGPTGHNLTDIHIVARSASSSERAS